MTNNLIQYRDVKKEIEHIEEEIKRLETRMYGPRVSIISDMPGAPRSNADQIGNNLIKLEMLRERYKNTLEELCDQQLKIENMIEQFEPLERDLIRYRYVDGLKWNEVFKKIGYGQRQTFRIHEKIIEKLEKMAHTGN